ncbi:MAG: hypothetical protein DLM52_09535 [Chthoniobacterales bacterium]|nr:MAG: hypothetical protein DLM52_09535 [Chthoniobacterales bacterium]
MFRRRGFHFLPLQTAWVQERLGLDAAAPLEEMHVLTADGNDSEAPKRSSFSRASSGGCARSACLPRSGLCGAGFRAPIVWSRPIVLAPVLPALERATETGHARGFRSTARRGLHRAPARSLGLHVADGGRALSRFQMAHLRSRKETDSRHHSPPRARLVLSLAGNGRRRILPGNATATAITQRRKHRARVSFATAKILSGAVLLFGIARFASGDLLKAWVGMIATVLILHFGTFDLVACGWRRAGFDFRPIMNRPITSRSLTEFWGRRWNGAFNQLVLDRRLDFHHGDRGRSGVLGFSPRLRSARHSAVHESHRRAMKTLLQIAALAQLAILVASALVPRTLDWRGNLAQLHPFLRRLFWVYGSFIVLTIIAFAALTFLHAGAIATRDPVARSLCAFIAIFWAARLFVQLAVFDARPFLTNAFYKIGYHALTIAFAFLILVYASAAL